MPEAGSPRPQAAPAGRTGSELGARVGSSLVMAAAALALTYVGGWPFAALWLLAAVVVLLEWTAMTRASPRHPLSVLGGLGLVALALSVLLSFPEWVLPAAFAAALVATLAVARSTRDRAWASAGFAYAAVIATVPLLVRADPRLGAVGVLWMFAVVWISDIAAYFIGRSVGGPKLWPRVSPKKTWSGFLGGLAAATIGGVAVATVAAAYGREPIAGPWIVALVSALASCVGQLGDLAESALKRQCEVKDSGHLIPGHGGVMDRLDAFWAVCALVGSLMFGARLAARW
jgi:phosphatidate cytidylyltransferase